MINRFFLTTILLLIFVPVCFALTANSSSYSVDMFGTGLATSSNASSLNYESTSLLISQSGTRNAESDNYRANIGFFENTTYYRTVSITSYSISPSSAVVGSTIGLYISALNVQSVWAKITSPNSQQQTVSLINNEFITYSPPSVVGTYTVTFYANISSGAIASVVSYFDFTAQPTNTPPSSSSSSGGGGGTTTIIEKCTYNWDCTPWSLCSDGNTQRACKNTGTCNGTESKPIEEMPCSESLFDIALNLKNINLTENRTLKFNIDLTEKIGIEKIDTHIKYSIINKDGYEIFSQIETKAIQGNLSYGKEIQEIKLVDGKYTLRVDILYGNLQRAFAEQTFVVKDKVISLSLEAEKSTLNIQNLFEFLKKFKFIVIIISIGLCSLFILRNGHHQKIVKTLAEYKTKIKQNLKRIRSKNFLIILLGFIVGGFWLIVGKNIFGLVVNSVAESNNWIILTILVLGLLIFVYRKNIKEFAERTKENFRGKYPSNSIRGLINKKVYGSSGKFIGRIEDVIIEDNRIEKLKIKINKGFKINTKGILVEYNKVRGVGEIVFIEDNLFLDVIQ